MPRTTFEILAREDVSKFFQGISPDFRPVLEEGFATLATVQAQDYGILFETVIGAMLTGQGTIDDDRIAQLKIARDKKPPLLSAASVMRKSLRVGAGGRDASHA